MTSYKNIKIITEYFFCDNFNGYPELEGKAIVHHSVE